MVVFGGAYRSGAALRGDGLSGEFDARLRGRRRCQRSAERERDGRCKNTQHDFLPCDLIANTLVCDGLIPRAWSIAPHSTEMGFSASAYRPDMTVELRRR